MEWAGGQKIMSGKNNCKGRTIHDGGMAKW